MSRRYYVSSGTAPVLRDKKFSPSLGRMLSGYGLISHTQQKELKKAGYTVLRRMVADVKGQSFPFFFRV